MSNALWSEEGFLRPSFLSDEVWSKIYNNFLNHIGDPLEDLPTALEDNLERLEGLGISQPSMLAALRFEIEQAGDFGSIAERARVGSLGQGWSSLADIKLTISANGISMDGLVNTSILAALDASQTGQYAVSLPLGKIIGQDGRLAQGEAFVRPLFTLEQKTFNDLTLAVIAGGYQVATGAGEKFIFDETGKLQSFVSAKGEEITVTYDMNDRLSRYENAFGDYLEFTYDGAGKITSAEDGNGHVSSYTYSLNGELIGIEEDADDTVFTYDADGNLLTAERVGGSEITFTYDAEGRLSSQDIGGLVSESYGYDNAGTITITNGLAEETVIQIGPGGYIAGQENNLGQPVTITTNIDARTVTMNSPDGTHSVLTYDTLGRLVSVTNGNEDTVSLGYDSSTGRLISFTDAGGGVREFNSDSAGRLLSATWSDETSLNFDYDVAGKLTEFTNRRGQSVEYDYDVKGRVTDVSDSASGTLSYAYDSCGNVTSITTSAGVTDITYDAADRVTLIEYPDGRSLAYTYDSAGKRLSMVNQDNEGTFYTYDAAGRLSTLADDNGVLTSYTYDAAGRLSLETNSNGSYSEYEYEGAGRINEITNYDGSSAVTSFFQYTYDAAGRKLSSVTNDGSWVYDYDDAGQLIAADFTSTTVGIPSKNLQYQYDAAGNRIATIENSITTSYDTNELNQYETAGGKSFTYDDDGNLVAQTEISNNYAYVYDVDNRLIQVTKPGGIVISYEYDAFGNRSAIVDNGVRTEFLVDPFGTGNVVAEYDALGARIASYAHGLGLASRTDSAGALAFFDFDATGNVVGLTNDIGGIANSYVYTPFGDELYESETILNSFEFNGAFGVMEDADNLLYMRARTYDVELGRFLSEDPLYLNGDIGNLYRFSYNDPVQFVDPNGENPVALLILGAQFLGGAAAGFYAGLQTREASDARPQPGDYSGESQQNYQSEVWDAAGAWAGVGGATFGLKSPAWAAGVAFGLYFGLTGEGNAGGNDSNGDGRSDSPNGGNGGGSPGGDPDYPPTPQPPRDPNKPEDMGSPLVLDLNGDGINLYSVGDYGTYFDLRGNGQAVLTGWVEPEDGILAIDVNENGRIDNISELFGTQTTNGFSILKLQDSNSDGVINSSDTNFNKLLVWTDLNSDGVSQANELHTLSDLGITSINVRSSRVNQDIEGNKVTHESTFTINGLEQRIVDAWFKFDPYYTKNVSDYDFDIRTAFLPTLKGFGNLPDFHVAVSMDNDEGDPNSLISKLMDLADNLTLSDAMSDWNAVRSDVEEMLWSWAGVEAVSSSGRGTYVDGKHLAFYEAFRGEPFTQYGQPNPLPEAGDFIEDIYNYLVDFHTMQIIAQISGGEIYDRYGYNLYTGSAGGDLDLVQSGIDAVKIAAISSSDPDEVWARFAQFLGYTKGLDNLTPAEVAALDTAVLATGEPSISDWSDVVSLMTASLGAIIDSADDWGSHEIYYDNLLSGTSGDDVIEDTTVGPWLNNELRGNDGNDTLRGMSGHDKLMGGAGADILDGGDGDDFLLGGTGNDTYRYTSGNDTISEVGGSGSDTLIISATTGFTQSNLVDMYRYNNDLLLRFSNNVVISVEGFATAGQELETIVFESNSYTIDLTALTEQKFYGTAYGDALTIEGTSIQTLLAYGYAGNDIITADGGAAKFYGGDGYDSLIGDYLNDQLYGENQDDYLFGAAGADTLSGGLGNDTLDGGQDNDSLDGGKGGDTYIYGTNYGNDTIAETNTDASSISNQDTLKFIYHEVDDLVFSRQGLNSRDLKVSVVGDTDYLVLKDQFTATYSGGKDWLKRIENFEFSDGQKLTAEGLMVKMIADATTSGNDTILGFARQDTLGGDAGNDLLTGYEEGDTYLFGRGDGHDTIYDAVQSDWNTTTDIDQLVLDNDVLTTDILVLKGPGKDDVKLVISDTGDSIVLRDQGYRFAYGPSSYQVEEVVFADTTIWTTEDMQQMYLDTVATSGNDTIIGWMRDDVIEGLAGNDRLEGQAGSDTYVFGTGFGQDTIYDNPQYSSWNNPDVALFGGSWLSTDFSYTKVGNNLVMQSLLTSDKLTVEGFYNSTGYNKIENFIFSDNIIVSDSDIYTMTVPGALIVGTASGETLTGTAGDNRIEGRAGNDTINAGSGNDILVGEEGDDILKGQGDNDTYIAGPGNDSIEESHGTDKIEFGVGITLADLEIYRLDVSTIVQKLVIEWQGNSITIDKQFVDIATDYRVESLLFADTSTLDLINRSYVTKGTSGADDLDGMISNLFGQDDILYGYGGNDVINGDTGNDILDGGDGDDTLEGDSGDDTYIHSAGNDIIEEEWNGSSSPGFDTIKFGAGITLADLTIYRSGSRNMVIEVSDGSKITVLDQYYSTAPKQVESLTFADTSTYSLVSGVAIQIRGTSGNDTLNGNSPNASIDDVIYGYAGNDTISGNTGSDLLYGGDGTDTLNGGAGNDILHGEADNDTLNGDDGDDTIWGGDGNDIIYGGNNNDTLNGGNGADTLYGQSGNETINGDDGNDTLSGGSGNDTLNGGDGDDVIVEYYGGTDVIDGGAGIDTLDYSDASSYRVTVNLLTGTQTDNYSTPSSDTIFNIENVIGAGGIDTITGSNIANVLEGRNGADTIYGKDGNDTIKGDAGNDILYGENDNDIIYGGAGLDTMYGGAGADTFMFEAASAYSNIDVIKDFSAGDGDKINLHDLLAEYDPLTELLTDFVQFTTSGSNTVVKVDRDGTGSTYSLTQIATLEGVTGLTDEDALVTNGNLVV